ncbi:Nucleoporin nup49/NSP49 (Nuclear pore protein nup49/NSP49) [Dispira simplex]|nr:Nucleoporin nup49/NSP49 (Nuclear pore protein nup49/NSP49) [Dispira simplex]
MATFFGNVTQRPTPAPFGSAFGNPPSTSQTSQTVPTTTQTNSLTKKTRVADLPTDAKNTLEAFAKYQQEQLLIGEELAKRETPQVIRNNRKHLQELEHRRASLGVALTTDTRRLEELKHQVNKELRAIEATTRILGEQRPTSALPAVAAESYLADGQSPASALPFEYYYTIISGYEARYHEYNILAGQIEAHLVTLLKQQTGKLSHNSGDAMTMGVGGEVAREPTTSLTKALRHMNDSFLALSSRISSLHNQIDRIRVAHRTTT